MEDRKGAWWIAGLLTAYLVLAAILPVADDEVYYWCWAKEPQWSYYDHPPMTAVLIRISTSLFGDSVLALRLPACVASAFVVWTISRLTPSKPLMRWVICTPLFTLGAILITPDSPLVACWAAYLLWLVELHRRLAPNPDSGQPPITVSVGMWVIGGILLGCGVLSKYTMGLAVPMSLLTLLVSRASWKSWASGYLFHGVIAFIVASPILIYNIDQHFEPLLFQWRHVAEKPKNSLMSLGDFVGVQMLLFGTMPFTLWPWVCGKFSRFRQDPRLRVCACLYAIPLAFFVYKSTQSRLEGNWALVCFISFWPLASEWYDAVGNSRIWRWLTYASFLPPIVAIFAITTHLIWPLPMVPVKADRVYRQIAFNQATREIARTIRDRGKALPVYTGSYQLTALLRFQSLDARQIDGLTRPSHFTRPARHLTDVEDAYVVAALPVPAEFATGFDEPELIATIPVIYRGQTDQTLHIWRYTKSAESKL